MGGKARRSDMTEGEKQRERDLARRRAYLKSQGRGGMVDATPMQERIRYLHDRRGIPFHVISKRTGLSVQAIGWHHRGVNGKTGGPLKTCRWETANAVLSARFGPNDASSTVPSFSARRRVEALVAAGWPYIRQAEMVGMDLTHFHQRIRLRDRVSYEFDQRVRDMFDKCQFVDPADVGLPAFSIAYAKGIGRKRHFAPPGCWDPDTIDDPDAAAEWTGECGTANGFAIHIRDGIPVCEPCREASRAAESGNRSGVVRDGGVFSGAQFKKRREAAGLSRNELALKIGMTPDAVRAWEVGRCAPRPEASDKAATALKCLVDDFYVEMR